MKVLVIGAGVVGALAARELVRYGLEVTIVERMPDPGMGVTRANSAIVHAGYDDPPGTLRAELCSLGNALFEKVCEELDVEFKRVGSLVVAFDERELKRLEELLRQGGKNKVPKLCVVERQRLLEMEPRLNSKAVAALFAPTAGITEPWMLAIAAVENAVANGAKFMPNTEVVGFEVAKGRIRRVITTAGAIEADLVVNAAGLHADEVAALAGVQHPPIHPRKGEYILIDKAAGKIVHRVIFPTPTERSKGVLVLPTVDDGTLLGPNAVDLERNRKHDLRTTAQGLREVQEKSLQLVPELPFHRTIRTFAGLRPETPQKDFYISAETDPWGFINLGGMRSPGLTAAPAIAEYLVEYLLPERLNIRLSENKGFNPKHHRIEHPAGDTARKWDAMIEKDPSWGRIVCVCNEVTEAEIREAIRRGAKTLDGIKFRTRAMFGRCQGGFCATRVLKILSEELGIPLEKLEKSVNGSWILNGPVRGDLP
ncbi:MAG: FAD/NAD(P)-binding oxidoreductase [Thermotogae bacterium]|nr:NAD(P)/FAD-dependent oxidoreductase [Thermotogota bacterium]RKX43344.1 MAG: FAD/NAD(P)-binding oxidoreductase [Thermotogota bacterium]